MKPGPGSAGRNDASRNFYGVITQLEMQQLLKKNRLLDQNWLQHRIDYSIRINSSIVIDFSREDYFVKSNQLLVIVLKLAKYL